jgi:hypothetical protein
MSNRARRFWSAMLLLIGLPLYIVAAVNVVDLFDRPSPLVEIAVYVGLGLAWALPFRWLFRGIGRPDPDAPPEE